MGKERIPPLISVVVPVLYEGHRINSLIAHIKDIDRASRAEIIVVDGNPLKDTLQAITQEGVLQISSPPGRGPQMNAGAGRAGGEILLFLHADTRLPDNAFAKVARAMEDKRHVAGAFRLSIDSTGFLFRIIEYGTLIRSRVTRVPFGDQAIFLRKSYFFEIGGFRNMPIMEDVELMVRIRSQGQRIILLPEKVRTSARRWEQEGILTCSLRNWMLRALYVLKVPPEKLARFYTSGHPDKHETSL
jgi:rSAM/selenodomain-associated transferase 2